MRSKQRVRLVLGAQAGYVGDAVGRVIVEDAFSLDPAQRNLEAPERWLDILVLIESRDNSSKLKASLGDPRRERRLDCRGARSE